jgi:DNA-binding beta-propeller fold protein YncE
MRYLFLLVIIACAHSCKYDKVEFTPDASGYPPNIANIMVKKCATAGCHNAQSRSACGGLDFSSWEKMFEGGRNGTSVIPYSTDYSYMLYSVNTDSTRGPRLLPTMPYNQPALSDAEYNELKNWIAEGAPDKNGFVKFSDNPNRKKLYITMQGCDVIGVVDRNTNVIMRYIPVGHLPTIESPHQVRVSPDGQYWYVVFVGGDVVQKYRTSDDSFVGEANIGFALWNTIIFSPDGSKGYVNALDLSNAQTKVINLDNMTVEQFGITITKPHGGFITNDGRWLYLTSQIGNHINKVDLSTAPFYDSETINLSVTTTGINCDPHEMMLSPDGSKYFVSCQTSSEVQVLNTSNDSLLAVIPVGKFPQEFATSATYPYIFVTCSEEQIDATKKGKVYAIDYNTLQIVFSIYTGFQPHGIVVDDERGLVYVSNLNYDSSGPPPHHVGVCAGRNGYLTIISLANQQLYQGTFPDGTIFQYKNELLPFPYYISYRN